MTAFVLRARRVVLPATLTVSVVVAVAATGCSGPSPTTMDAAIDTAADSSPEAASAACDGSTTDPNTLLCVANGGGTCNPSYVCQGMTCPAGCFAEPIA